MQVDEELKGEIHTEMIKSIFKFEIRAYEQKREIHIFCGISLANFIVISRFIQSW